MKYMKKILLISITIIALIISHHFGLKNIIKYSSLLSNAPKMSDSCTTGSGVLKYVLDDNTPVRSIPAVGGTKLSSVNKCSQVRVYCTSGQYSRVSKEPAKWINSSYLSEIAPEDCNGSLTTTTDQIRFQFDSLETNYKYGNFFADREASLTANISNISNLATDDTNLINVRISSSAVDKTSEFNITYGELKNNSMSIRIDSKDNHIYNTGTYKVVVSSGNISEEKTFQILGLYYDFSGEFLSVTDFEGNPTDEKNIWKINLIKDGINNNDGFAIKVLSNDRDYTSKFTYTLSSEGYTISNKYNSLANRPIPGDYKIIISYTPSYSPSSRGVITKEFPLTLSKRSILFSRKSFESRRYDRSQKQVPYIIEISKYKSNIVFFKENNEEKELSLESFNNIYADFDFKNVYFTNGEVSYRYNENCTVINYNDSIITYIDKEKVSHNVSVTEFNELYPEAITKLLDGTYTFDDEGNLLYKTSGLKMEDTKSIRPENKTVFANQGGEFYYKYAYDTSKLNDEDFANADIKIKNNKNIIVGNEENFFYEITHDSGMANIKIIYDDILASNVGDYNLEITFPNSKTIKIPFTLYDGEVDYFLHAQVDDHLTSSKPMPTSPYPPANQNYEYYIGFYLVKGGSVETRKNTDAIDVKIYDHRADLTTEGTIYCYDQVEYDFQILNYLNNTIRYQVTLEDGTSNIYTQTLEELKNSNYEDMIEYIEFYNYDDKGSIISDNYPLHINRVYQDEFDIRHVVYNENDEMLLTDFQVKYSELSYYIINIFNFDDITGDIILGSLRGNYRIPTSQCNDVTKDFNIEIIDDDYELVKAIKVLPKTEIKKGDYYAYVSYGILPGIGYINNKSDAVITKEAYPEYWGKSIHMVQLTYDKEVYELELGESKITNVGNNRSRMYKNITSNITIPITHHFIYDYSKFEVNIYKNQENVTSKFNIINTLDSEYSNFSLDNPYLSITNKVNETEAGTYKVVLSYQNKSSDKTEVTREFTILDKYYDIKNTHELEIDYVHNYEQTNEFDFETSFISLENLDNITPNINRIISGGTDTLILDKTNKVYKNKTGEIVFKYNIEYEKINDIKYKYKFFLTNVRGTSLVGTYNLELSYQEPSLELVTSDANFQVVDDEYIFKISEVIPKADNDGRTLSFNIDTEYIHASELDKFNFKVMHYKSGVGETDVLGNEEMFTYTIHFDDTLEEKIDYHGVLTLYLKDETILDDYYYLTASFKNSEIEEKEIGVLSDLFTWSIDNISISGNYHDEITNEDVTLNKFYKNIKNTEINIMLSSVHEDNIRYNINKECLNTNTCVPNYMESSLNNRFISKNTTGKNGLLTLKLKEDETIESGTYALVLYYGNNDYKVYTLRIYDDFASILIGDPIITSKINEETTSDELYANKDGKIVAPITVYGVDYDNLDVQVKDSSNRVAPFTFDKLELVNNHKLILNYLSSNHIEPGNYTLSVNYKSKNTVYEDTYTFKMNSDYFDFSLSEPILSPNPLFPNSSNGGNITLRVDTLDIKNLLVGENGIEANSNKYVFAKNTIILNGSGKNVTDKFKISVSNIETSSSAFNLIIHYDKLAIEPGTYEIKVSYNVLSTTKTLSKMFKVSNYLKTLEIDEEIIESNASDDLLHRNVVGTYKLKYSSDYNIDINKIKVKVLKDNKDITTDNFTIKVDNNYINIVYNATNLAVGDYIAHITYQEEGEGEFYLDKKFKINGTYKNIVLDNLTSSSETMYADKEGYYQFKVNKEAFINDIDNFKIRIYNEEDKIMYSSFSNEGTNHFEVINDLKNSNYFRINIIPFQANVGKYKLMLYLSDETNNYYHSNPIYFTIDDYFYKVNISESSIKQIVKYQNDSTSIYDIDGAHISFKFTADYKNMSSYKVILKKNNTLINTYDNITSSGNNYILDFNTGSLKDGTYQVMLVNNELVYKTINMEIKKYIPISSITVNINNKSVTSYTLNNQEQATLAISYSPMNATNPIFTKTSSNNSILSVGKNSLKALKTGKANLIISSKDKTVNVPITINSALTSKQYNITSNTIYVNKMTSTSMSKKTFISNLVGLSTNYKIYDKNNKDVTNTTSLIGTCYRIVNGGVSYYVVIVGDLNGDGKITTSDVAYEYQYIRKKININNSYVKMAADIRKQNNISLGDVAKLYQFVRGKIKSL